MTVSNELIDSLLANYKKPEGLIGEHGILKQLAKRLVGRALEAELAEHLGHGRHEPVANPAGNTRNGKPKKTLKGSLVNCRLKSRETATAASGRRSSPSTKPAGTVSTTRSCRCMPAA